MRAWLKVCLLGLLIGCGDGEAPSTANGEDRTFHVGFLVSDPGSFSGPAAAARRRQTEAQVQAAQLAVKQLRERGGLLVDDQRWMPILHVSPRGSRPEDASAGLQELMNQRHVVALVGPMVSRTARPVAHWAEQREIPMITPTATRHDITADKRFVFRVAPDDLYQARAVARFVLDDLQAKRIALLYDISSDYARSLGEAFQRSVTAGGGKVVACETYDNSEADFVASVRRIQLQRPDFLLLPDPVAKAEAQLAAVRSLGLDAAIMLGDGWNPAQVSVPDLFDQVYRMDYWSPESANDANQAFLRDYQDAYGHEPTASVALTYDAFGLLFTALRESESLEATAIRDALADLEDYPGVTGGISYAGSGDPLRPLLILQIQAGRSILVQHLTPDFVTAPTTKARPSL